MSEKFPMTEQGWVRLEEELKPLKSVARPEVIRAIAEAREHGDLSENAEYHAARERQSFIEGRVAELEDKMACRARRSSSAPRSNWSTKTPRRRSPTSWSASWRPMSRPDVSPSPHRWPAP